MELVIDANIFISALIKDSHTRHFLILRKHSFYVPEFVFEEIQEHIEEITQKSSLSEDIIKEVLDQIILLANITIIPFEDFKEFENEAIALSPDIDDIAYVALALKLKCPIWSNDKDLKKSLKEIKVYNSEEILKSN